jgi:hypothetical protein
MTEALALGSSAAASRTTAIAISADVLVFTLKGMADAVFHVRLNLGGISGIDQSVQKAGKGGIDQVLAA